MACTFLPLITCAASAASYDCPIELSFFNAVNGTLQTKIENATATKAPHDVAYFYRLMVEQESRTVNACRGTAYEQSLHGSDEGQYRASPLQGQAAMPTPAEKFTIATQKVAQYQKAMKFTESIKAARSLFDASAGVIGYARIAQNTALDDKDRKKFEAIEKMAFAYLTKNQNTWQSWE